MSMLLGCNDDDDTYKPIELNDPPQVKDAVKELQE